MATSDDTPNSKPRRLRDVLRPLEALHTIWAVAPFAAALFYFGLLPLRSWSYWWHVTMGRLIDYWGAVPAANHFLYTMKADAPSFIQPWMSEWLLAQIDQLGGVQLALIVRNSVAAVGFGVLGLWTRHRAQSTVRGALLTVVGLAVAAPCVRAQPGLLVWPIFIALLALGYGIRHRRVSVGWVVVFPAAAALWANLAGSFLGAAATCLAFGIAALVDGWTDGRRLSIRRLLAWCAALVGSLAAPLLNPRGTQIYGHLADVVGNGRIDDTAAQWMPMTVSNPLAVGIVFYGAVVIAAYVWWRKRDTLDPADVVIGGALAVLSAACSGALLWFGLALPVVLAPYVARPSTGADDNRGSCLLRIAQMAVAAGLVVSAVLVQPGMKVRRDVLDVLQPAAVRQRAPMKGLLQPDVPLEHTQTLRIYRAGMRVFHPVKYAGYLMYHLTDEHPHRMVFVDRRIQLPPPEIWRLYNAVNESAAWRGVFQQYGIDAALLSVDTQSGLIGRMRAADGWSISFEDDENVLFLRKE